MKRQLLAFLLISILLSSVPVALAQSGADEMMENALKGLFIFLFGDNYPEEWLTVSGLMQFIILPFVALLAVMYGILTELNIFRRSQTARTVIAVTFAGAGGVIALRSMKGWMIANTTLAVWGFGIMLFLGIAFWATGGILKSWFDVKGVYDTGAKKFVEDMKKREKQDKRLKDLRAREMLLWSRWNRTRDPDMKEKLRKQLEDVGNEINDIEKKIYEDIKEGGPGAAGPV